MQVYHFRPRTGEWVGGISNADESPLEPGVFLLPGFATDMPPPDVPQGKAAVFANGEWSLVSDHRGQYWWTEDEQPVLVTELGDPAELGLSPNGPPMPEPGPPPRRLLAKSTIIARLTDPQLEAAIEAMTVRQRERWRAPDKPQIYVDDPELLAVLAFVEADPTVVLAETD